MAKRKYKNNICEENGKFYGKITIKGEQKQFLCHGATSRNEAKAIVDAEKYKLRQEIAGIREKTKKKIKMSTLLNLYEKYAKVNKSSYNTFDKFAINKVRGYFGESKIANDIKQSDVEDFKKYLIEEQRKASTINKYILMLGKMYKLGIKQGDIDCNPVSEIKTLREDNYKIRFLTKDEEKALFTEVTKGYEVIGRDKKEKTIYPYIHLEPLIICALQTGMRKSEILECKKNWIDLDFGFISVLKSKSGLERKIPISETLREIFEEKLNDKSNTTEYIFINPETNNPYTDIKHSFHSVLKKANIENFRFHDLRHTVATRLVESGIDLAVVKEILGHAKIDTTMRYAHPVPKRKLEAINVLNNYNE